MAAAMENTLVYEGCNFFRQRLILATLSGKSVKIKKIRARDEEPGLKGKTNASDHMYFNVVPMVVPRSITQSAKW